MAAPLGAANESVDCPNSKRFNRSRAWVTGPNPQFEFLFDDGKTVQIATEPVWSEAFIAAEDLMAWLRRIGHKDGVFIDDADSAEDDLMDTRHPHFSAELALSVTAWRGPARQEKFIRGEKAAIEKRIEEHPDAWLGDERSTIEPKRRIATLTDLKPKGGGRQRPGRNPSYSFHELAYP